MIISTRFCKQLLYAMLILLPSLSCKKDKKEEVQDELPTFGTCEAVGAAGRLVLTDARKFTYQTSGGGTIVADLSRQIILTHKDYSGFKIEFWGDFENENINITGNHENLNGKHIKDWNGNRRTLIFPDGAKITIVTDGVHETIVSVSIYDGAQCHHFNALCNTLEYSLASSRFAKQLDDAEADGETSTFEITETGLWYKTIYSEDTPGNKTGGPYDLGELQRANPTMVHDYYDDPRMDHT